VNFTFYRNGILLFTARSPFGQKIVTIFSFFFVWAGTLWALVTSSYFGKALKGPGKLPQGKVFSPSGGKFIKTEVQGLFDLVSCLKT
jgi:hypothetical protein